MTSSQHRGEAQPHRDSSDSAEFPAPQFSPADISRFLGSPYPPTKEQAAIIAAPPHGSTLVIAGAGAGKTETMAARVVWLVANNYIQPAEVLGLTFTRKAASELSTRIRTRLNRLAHSEFVDQLPPNDPRRSQLQDAAPFVATYDSYAGDLVREFGLLIPLEPQQRIISDTEKTLILEEILRESSVQLYSQRSAANVREDIAQLDEQLDNYLLRPEELAEFTTAAIQAYDDLPSKGSKISADAEKFYACQQNRLITLQLLRTYRATLRERNLITFGQQMAYAAQLAEQQPEVGATQRRRFRAIMLDEYQDTSHSQRILLSHLFGKGHDPHLSVTAVGDPMQSIYEFRGAVATNLEHFREDFAHPHQPVTTHHLTTSWRNPPEVLEMANTIIKWSETSKLVTALHPRENSTPGHIRLGFFDKESAEIEWLATQLHQHWQQHQQLTNRATADNPALPFRAAVLVRKNADALPIYEALRERGVPAELSDDNGLLHTPEVADVYATLCILADPNADLAMLRLLTNSRWNLGAADLHALAQTVKHLSKTSSPTTTADDGGVGATQKNAAQAEATAADAAAVDAAEKNTEENAEKNTEETDSYDTLRTELSSVGLSAGTVEQLIAAVQQANAEQNGSITELILERPRVASKNLSPAGQLRVQALAAELNTLRRHSLEKPLSELISDIERITGVRTEVLTRWYRDPETSVGTSHLNRFRQIIDEFCAAGVSNLPQLVTMLRVGETAEKGFGLGEVQRKDNTVQILTVHRSKGLEWDIVAMPFCTGNNYHDSVTPGRRETWAGQVASIPPEIQGDPDPELPVLDLSELPNKQKVRGAIYEYKTALKLHLIGENRRIFYVGMTRSERVLLLSGSATAENTTTYREPCIDLALLRQNRLHAAGGSLTTPVDTPEIHTWSYLGRTQAKKWHEAKETGFHDSPEMAIIIPNEEFLTQRETAAAEIKEQHKQEKTAPFTPPALSDADAMWPANTSGVDEPGMTQAVEWINGYLAGTGSQEENSIGTETTTDSANAEGETNPPVAEQHGTQINELFAIWETETALLIDEQKHQLTSIVDVEMPSTLSPTAVMNLRRNPEQFSRRLRRPVPMKPQRYTKRGTAFHNWVEQHYGMQQLLDEDALPGAADATSQDPHLEKLKTQFLRSTWANRKPHSIEQPFTIQLGGRHYQGRIDAVFHDCPDTHAGWMIVDWKTGLKPTGEDRAVAETQLAMYRIGLARVLKQKYGVEVPLENIRAVFHYVATNHTYEPEHLDNEEQLLQMIQRTVDNALGANHPGEDSAEPGNPNPDPSGVTEVTSHNDSQAMPSRGNIRRTMLPSKQVAAQPDSSLAPHPQPTTKPEER